MQSPGYRDGGDGNKFAWCKCSVIKEDNSGHAPGKMVTGDLHPVDNDKENNHWCWLTLDGEHRAKKDEGRDEPDLGPSTDGAYPGSKYSCLTRYEFPNKSDRFHHGGCFVSN